MRTHGLLSTAVATFAALAGGLALLTTPALAAPPEAPLTEAATGVTASTVTLHGELNPLLEAETGWHFLYSTEASCTGGTATPSEPIANAKAEKEQFEVTGLQPSKTYSFCLVATNAAEESTEGNSLSFTTAGVTPEVITEGASGVTASDAALEASIDPENQETTYNFEYATSEATVLEGKGTVVEGSPPAPPLAAVFEGLTAGPTDIGGGLSPATTYYWRVIATNATGSTSGTVEHFTTPAKPTLTTGEATSVTRSSVALAGTVSPEGAETKYRFAYIDETGYQAALAEGAANPYASGRSSAEASAGSSFTVQPVGPITIEELHPGTTYHYALVATNSVGTTIGPDRTFTTSAPTPPIAVTGAAAGVTQLAATIIATVDTRELQTSFQFEFGTTPLGGSLAPATVIPGSGSGSTVGIAIAFANSLQPGTTYYYRAIASNADGTSYGAERSFTTATFPPAFTTPAAPPFVPYTSLAELAAREPTAGHTTTPKALTNAQKLAHALKACDRKPKKQRASCKRRARKKYTKLKHRTSRKR